MPTNLRTQSTATAEEKAQAFLTYVTQSLETKGRGRELLGVIVALAATIEGISPHLETKSANCSLVITALETCGIANDFEYVEGGITITFLVQAEAAAVLQICRTIYTTEKK